MSREREMGTNGKEEWRKMADTHMMRDEEVKAKGVEASKRPPGHSPGEVLHQRRKLPYSPAAMAAGGFLISAAIGYFVLCSLKRPDASAKDVAKVATGAAEPQGGRPPH